MSETVTEDVKADGPTRTQQEILAGLVDEANKFIAEEHDQRQGIAGAIFMAAKKDAGTQIGVSMEIDGPPGLVMDLAVSLMERALECIEVATGEKKAHFVVLGVLQEAMKRRRERNGE